MIVFDLNVVRFILGLENQNLNTQTCMQTGEFQEAQTILLKTTENNSEIVIDTYASFLQQLKEFIQNRQKGVAVLTVYVT